MFTNGQRVYDVTTLRYGAFLCYSNTRKSCWVKMDGDISTTCITSYYLVPNEPNKILLDQKRIELFKSVEPKELDVHVFLYAMLND